MKTKIFLTTCGLLLAGCATHFQPANYPSCSDKESIKAQVECYRDGSSEQRFINAEERSLFLSIGDRLVEIVEEEPELETRARMVLSQAAVYVSQSVRASQRATGAAISQGLQNYSSYMNSLQPSQPQQITPFTCSQTGQYMNCY